jgi:hypothetical protein
MRRVRLSDLADDQKIKEHPHRSQLLLNGRLGRRKVFNPGGYMEWAYSFELKTVSGAPIKKLPARAGVGTPSVTITDRCGKKVDVGFCDLRTSTDTAY